MHNLVNYLLESGISLTLFALIYVLFLRRETFFGTNRLFLLFPLCFRFSCRCWSFRCWRRSRWYFRR